jgi:polysaccharide export outer membrane protein
MIRVLVSALLLLATQTGASPGVHEQAQADIDTYLIGPRDVLTVTVFDEPQLTGRYRVDNDGTITFPLIGRIAAGGLTPRAVEMGLTKQLADGYLKNPQISVEVEQYRSQSVFIIGEVRSPGKYPLTGRMNLIEAIAQAGSTTPAAASQLLILHPREPTADVALKPEDEALADVTRVNIRELQTGVLSQNVTIHDGDTIFVPRADTLFITGYVKTPGSYVMEPGMTVLQAISLAGGITERGSNRRIKVLRTVKGKQTETSVELTDRVQPGDTIQVLQRIF